MGIRVDYQVKLHSIFDKYLHHPLLESSERKFALEFPSSFFSHSLPFVGMQHQVFHLLRQCPTIMLLCQEAILPFINNALDAALVC